MGRMIMFEERDFQGRSHEPMVDCADLSTVMDRCLSIRVESGTFVIYDRPNFMGNQILLPRGDYPDIQRMMSMEVTGKGIDRMMSDSIRSVLMIPPHRGTTKMKVFERESFGGQMKEVKEDIENIMDHLRMSDIQSVQVMEGHFVMFEQPKFRGKMVYVMPGEHKSLREMSNISKISSIRRILDSV